jgi:hypothetical protein
MGGGQGMETSRAKPLLQGDQCIDKTEMQSAKSTTTTTTMQHRQKKKKKKKKKKRKKGRNPCSDLRGSVSARLALRASARVRASPVEGKEEEGRRKEGYRTGTG